MITCVKKDTRKEIDRPNRIGKLVQRMSNKNLIVNYGGCRDGKTVNGSIPQSDDH